MNIYHFSLGNSTDGPVGYCALIQAPTQAHAIQRLKELLPDNLELPYTHSDLRPGEYISVYFNPGQISSLDIDDHEEGQDKQAASEQLPINAADL